MPTPLSLQSLRRYLVEIIMDENSPASKLAVIVLMFSVIWFLVFYSVKRILRPLSYGKPWLYKALEREYERSSKKMIEDLGIDMTKEEAINFSMNDWPRMQAIYLQHFVGSLFCVPSLLGIGDPSTASSLAICGILSEMGWELQDMAEIFYVRKFDKDGKTKWPDAIVALFVVHHSLSTILGLPMILYYRHLRVLHWLCFDLQFAAAVALSISEYTKVLDITKKSHLRQFKVLNFVAFVTMVWTRLIHWVYLCANMILIWYRDKAWSFLIVGTVLSLAFSGFNFFACVKPFYKKFTKFLHVCADHENLPVDAPPERRRASVVQLELAVGDLLADDEFSEVAKIFEPIFKKRIVSRRQTMPSRPGTMRRQSLNILRAKSVYIKTKPE